jgi:hypothetical protein
MNGLNRYATLAVLCWSSWANAHDATSTMTSILASPNATPSVQTVLDGPGQSDPSQPYIFTHNYVDGDLDGNFTRATIKLLGDAAPTIDVTVFATAGGTLSSFAYLSVDISFTYGVSLYNPDPNAARVIAPIIIKGLASADASGSGPSNATSVSAALTYSGGPLQVVGGHAVGDPTIGGAGSTVVWGGPALCGSACGTSGDYVLASTIQSGLVPTTTNPFPFSFTLTGHLTALSTSPGVTLSSHLLLDPFIELDPAWAAEHPGYVLAVEPGLGNSAPVPELGSAWTLAGGLLILALMRRRGPPKSAIRSRPRGAALPAERSRCPS